MTSRSSAVFILAALSATLALTGCSSGKKSFTLKGSVSYKGEPLTAGVLRLHMADNHMSVATIQPDGSFEATDVVPGEAKLTLEENTRIRRVGPFGRQGGKKKASVPIPPKYKEVDKSGLVFTLKAGDPLNIQIE
jgi:hypothetical protein